PLAERLAQFLNDAHSRFAALPEEERTITKQRNIVMVLLRGEYLDIPEQQKRAALQTYQKEVGILDGVLVDTPKQEKSPEIERLRRVVASTEAQLAAVQLLYTQEVRETFQKLTQDDPYNAEFLEKLNTYRYDPMLWNVAVEFAEQLKLTDKDLLNALDDFLGD